MTRPQVVIAVAVFVAAVAGCSQKGPECEAVTKVINPAAEKLKAAGNAKGDKAADQIKTMNDIATTSDGVAGDLAKLKLTVPELQKHSADYQAMARGLAGAAREMAQAATTTEDAGKRIEKTAKELETSTIKYAGACAAAKDPKDQEACRRFSEALKKLPSDGSKTAEVEEVAVELVKVAWKSDDTKAAAQAVVAAVRGNNKVMLDLAGAQTKAEAAQKKFNEAADKEDKVVDGINKFCQE